MKLLVPHSVDFVARPDDGVEAVSYDAAAPIPEEHRDAEALVVWANSAENMASARTMPNLRWVQAMSAGAEDVINGGFADGVRLAKGSGVHDRTVSEHAVALGLTLLRRMPEAAQAQRDHVWSREIGGVQPMYPEGRVTSFIRANVLIWGFGNIGQHLAGILTALGANVRGVARSAGERAGFPVIAEGDIDEALPETDVLIMILPGVEATRHALNARRLELLPKHAYVVNVGRGSTVDEDALIAALESGSIAGAATDVASQEPLPAESPLWDAPNLVITPHGAGGRPDLGPELIRENLENLRAGRRLRNEVDR